MKSYEDKFTKSLASFTKINGIDTQWHQIIGTTMVSELTAYFTDLALREGLPAPTPEDVAGMQAVIDALWREKQQRKACAHRRGPRSGGMQNICMDCGARLPLEGGL